MEDSELKGGLQSSLLTRFSYCDQARKLHPNDENGVLWPPEPMVQARGLGAGCTLNGLTLEEILQLVGPWQRGHCTFGRGGQCAAGLGLSDDC
jgi:hypothetical protein